MKKIFFFYLSFIIGIFLIISDIHGKEKKVSWPLIQSFKTSYHFIDHENMAFKYQIVSPKGKPLYQMECYLNAYEHEDKDNDFDYSGDFECRLIYLKDKYEYPTILTEEKYPTRDWESRGRFLIEELTGKCADYPEYGKIRHFRLRGMELTIEIKNFKSCIQ